MSGESNFPKDSLYPCLPIPPTSPTVQITLSTLGEIAVLQKILVGGDCGWRRLWMMVMMNGDAGGCGDGGGEERRLCIL